MPEGNLVMNMGLRQDFLRGAALGTEIGQKIGAMGFAEGPITSPITCGIIMQCLYIAPGSYLETGTRYGGSAILARRLAKTVVTIDPGYDEEYQKVIAELKIEGITKIVKPSEVVKRLPKADYTVGFVDGLHEYDQIIKYDFPLMKKYVKGFVIFDDVDIEGVEKAILELSSDWSLLYYHYPSTAVLTNLELSNKLHLGII